MSEALNDEELEEIVAGWNAAWQKDNPGITGAPAPFKLYIVKPNDTVSTIAELFGCTCDEIYQRNHIGPQTILYAGNKLIVRNYKGI